MLRTPARILLVLAALLFAAPARATTVAGEQSYHIAYSDRLVTDVFVNGRGPFTFLIDTASSRTVIFEHVRKAIGLGYSSPDPITVYGINDAVSARAARPDTIHVAGIDVKGITIGVLPDIAQRGDPDGVLGTDILARYFVVLDRKTMKLRLLNRDSDQARAYANWSSVPLQLRPLKTLPVQFWFMTVRYNDHPVSTLLDLGAGLTLLNWDAADQMDVLKKNFTKYGPPPEEVRDVLGKVAPAIVVKGVAIRMPDHAWHKQEVLVSDAPVFDFLEMSDRASAILGPGLLKDNSLAIDFQGGRLYLGPAIDQSQ
ncbi:MAG TPA: aspartyl protease family protein [Rhizomicrobium sp.]|nr:aspartyl protease family protein [Rhizomicrobium sp.]